MDNKKRAEFIVSGLVQGVGFRYFVYRHALELKLSGYTKNLYDGSVKVVVEGRADRIALLHEFLKQGPSHSYVDSVRVLYFEFSNEFTDFRVQ